MHILLVFLLIVAAVLFAFYRIQKLLRRDPVEKQKEDSERRKQEMQIRKQNLIDALQGEAEFLELGKLMQENANTELKKLVDKGKINSPEDVTEFLREWITKAK